MSQHLSLAAKVAKLQYNSNPTPWGAKYKGFKLWADLSNEEKSRRLKEAKVFIQLVRLITDDE